MAHPTVTIIVNNPPGQQGEHDAPGAVTPPTDITPRPATPTPAPPAPAPTLAELDELLYAHLYPLEVNRHGR